MPELDDILNFRSSLTPESDRGCAVIAAAYVDDQLADLLKAAFVEDDDVVAELLGNSGPLGSFSARISMAFALGFISQVAHRDLNLIRKVRNEFSHQAKPISFAEPAIASRCREMTSHIHDRSALPRDVFTNTVMAVLAAVQAATKRALRPSTPSPPMLNKDDVRAELDAVWPNFAERFDQLDNTDHAYTEKKNALMKEMFAAAKAEQERRRKST